jgi:hypothetical protein
MPYLLIFGVAIYGGDFLSPLFAKFDGTERMYNLD